MNDPKFKELVNNKFSQKNSKDTLNYYYGVANFLYNIDRLKEAPIEKIIVSDTIKITNEQLFDKLEIISVAEVFAESIIRINQGGSISSLFK